MDSTRTHLIASLSASVRRCSESAPHLCCCSRGTASGLPSFGWPGMKSFPRRPSRYGLGSASRNGVHVDRILNVLALGRNVLHNKKVGRGQTSQMRSTTPACFPGLDINRERIQGDSEKQTQAIWRHQCRCHDVSWRTLDEAIACDCWSGCLVHRPPIASRGTSSARTPIQVLTPGPRQVFTTPAEVTAWVGNLPQGWQHFACVRPNLGRCRRSIAHDFDQS